MRILTLLGARPQFIKASMLSRALKKAGIEEIIVHSGQHYDDKISQIFFDELEIPRPATNLRIGSGSHAVQTGGIMREFEHFIRNCKPVKFILVYGDTNTTLAGALVSSKCNISLIHVEAGLRSFNRSMPEEINRIVTDKLSSLLFCPTKNAVQNLRQEGIHSGVYLSGDVMHDSTMYFSRRAEMNVLEKAQNIPDEDSYYLATIHRPSNTDNLEQLISLLTILGKLDLPVIMPLHPRTRQRLKNITINGTLKLIDPVGYLSMLSLIQRAKAVITDSGGVQKEAYWLQSPCITLRDETEWEETLTGNWNQLAGNKTNQLFSALGNLPDKNAPQESFGRPIDGSSASSFIANKIKEWL